MSWSDTILTYWFSIAWHNGQINCNSVIGRFNSAQKSIISVIPSLRRGQALSTAKDRSASQLKRFSSSGRADLTHFARSEWQVRLKRLNYRKLNVLNFIKISLDIKVGFSYNNTLRVIQGEFVCSAKWDLFVATIYIFNPLKVRWKHAPRRPIW